MLSGDDRAGSHMLQPTPPDEILLADLKCEEEHIRLLGFPEG